jgi:nucleoside-diphosphate-sugar epimerase
VRALVVGGTGPTGPGIVDGLRERGYAVTVLHSGRHEVDLPSDVLHVHADPYAAPRLSEALAGRTFELAVATYGRLRVVADVLRSHTGRLVSVGGAPYDLSIQRPAREDDPMRQGHAMLRRMAETERHIFDLPDLDVTHLRYARVFGPRQPDAVEWSIVRRLLDGRRTILLVHGGLTLEHRVYVGNAAAAVLAAVDRPEASRGRVYNVADEEPRTERDRVLAMARALGVEVDVAAVPELPNLVLPYWVPGRTRAWSTPDEPAPQHQLRDTGRIRRELGFTDPVRFEEAIAHTVRWYADNRPAPGGEIERQLGDSFDYAAEDRVVAAWRHYVDTLAEVDIGPPAFAHAYANPRAAQDSGGRPG